MGGRVPIYSHRIKSLWTQCSLDKEGKVPACTMQVDGGGELQLASFVTLALDGGKPHSLATWLPGERTLGTYWIRFTCYEMTSPQVTAGLPRPIIAKHRPFTVSEVFTNCFSLAGWYFKIVFCNPVRAGPTPFLLQPESVYHEIPTTSISANISPWFTTVRMIR